MFDDRGKPHVLLETDATGVREWVRGRIDELRGAAGPLTAAELEGDIETG